MVGLGYGKLLSLSQRRHEKSPCEKSPKLLTFVQSYVLYDLMPVAGCQDHSEAYF